MRNMADKVVKTRPAPIGFAGRDIQLELTVSQLKGGEQKGQFQATYFNLADPYIWGESFPTSEEAIKDVDRLLDKHIERLKSFINPKQ